MENKEIRSEIPTEIAGRKVEEALKLSENDKEGEVFLWSEVKYPFYFDGRLEEGEKGSLEVVDEVKEILDISDKGYHRDIVPKENQSGEHYYMTFKPSRKYDNVYLALETAGDWGRLYGGKLAIVVTKSTKKYASQFRPYWAK